MTPTYKPSRARLLEISLTMFLLIVCLAGCSTVQNQQSTVASPSSSQIQADMAAVSRSGEAMAAAAESNLPVRITVVPKVSAIQQAVKTRRPSVLAVYRLAWTPTSPNCASQIWWKPVVNANYPMTYVSTTPETNVLIPKDGFWGVRSVNTNSGATSDFASLAPAKNHQTYQP